MSFAVDVGELRRNANIKSAATVSTHVIAVQAVRKLIGIVKNKYAPGRPKQQLMLHTNTVTRECIHMGLEITMSMILSVNVDM